MAGALALTNADAHTPLSHASLPSVALDGVWIGSLGNGFSGETVIIYTITFIVLVALVIALAALIKYEIGREGGEGEGGESPAPPSPPS